MSRLRGWRVLLVVAALFAASEIALRLLTDASSRWNVRLGAAKEFDPVVQFRIKPFYDFGNGGVTNELGYLAPRNLDPTLPRERLRLIYLGDSNSVMPTFGNYPQQVETLLEPALGVDVETVNAAVPGYSSQNARLLFEHELSRFDGHYFFIYLGWNDLGQYGPEGLPYKLHDSGYELSPLQRVLTNVYSIRFLYALELILRRQATTVNEPMSLEHQKLYDTYRPRHFYDNLRAILQLAKQRYPRVYVMNLATITSDEPTEWEMRTAHFPIGMNKNVHKLHVLVQKYNRAVTEVAREEGVPMIDLFALFDSREARRTFTDSCHVNRDGAGRIARVLSDSILAREAEAPSVRGERAQAAAR
jgi:lysophospholipase L1-like esterase